MNVNELINKLCNTLNELINRNDLSDKTTNELLETLKIIKNCANCKDKGMHEYDLDEFHKSTNGIKKYLDELEKEKRFLSYVSIYRLSLNNSK